MAVERIEDMVIDLPVLLSNSGWPTLQYGDLNPETSSCQYVAKTPYGPITLTIAIAGGWPWQPPAAPEALTEASADEPV